MVVFGVWILFFVLATLAYADPTKDKNIGQEIAEKFIIFLFDGNFQEATKLIKDENDSDAIERGAKVFKTNFDQADAIWQKHYDKEFNGSVLNSRTLVPQTLVSFRRGDDGKTFNVLVHFTEDHIVSISGKQKPWYFYWHYEMIFEVTDGKMTNLKDIIAPENLMILKPENCIAPVVC